MSSDYNTCLTLYCCGIECWDSWGSFAISCLWVSPLFGSRAMWSECWGSWPESDCFIRFLGGVPATPAIMFVPSRATHFEFPCFFQGELRFWLFKDRSSTCLSFEYLVVDCLADLGFPGCTRKQQDDRDILLAQKPWATVFSLLHGFSYHGFTPVWWTDCQDSLKCRETFLKFHVPVFNPISQQCTKIPYFILVSVQGN